MLDTTTSIGKKRHSSHANNHNGHINEAKTKQFKSVAVSTQPTY